MSIYDVFFSNFAGNTSSENVYWIMQSCFYGWTIIKFRMSQFFIIIHAKLILNLETYKILWYVTERILWNKTSSISILHLSRPNFIFWSFLISGLRTKSLWNISTVESNIVKSRNKSNQIWRQIFNRKSN